MCDTLNRDKRSALSFPRLWNSFPASFVLIGMKIYQLKISTIRKYYLTNHPFWFELPDNSLYFASQYFKTGGTIMKFRTFTLILLFVFIAAFSFAADQGNQKEYPVSNPLFYSFNSLISFD